MLKAICNEIKALESRGFTEVELLALVSDTSYEVVFYAKHNNQYMQSNALVENDVISSTEVDSIYKKVAEFVRQSKEFNPDKMNIVKASSDTVKIKYDEKRCRLYKIKKNWITEIGVL